MTSTYTPHAGSLAQRVIAHLQSGAASQLSPGEMVPLFHAVRAGTSNQLKAPRKFNSLVLHKNGKRALYTLPGVAPDWGDGDEDDDAPAPAAKKTTRGPAKHKADAGGRKTHVPQEAPAETERPPAIAALWDDGDVVLQNVAVNADVGGVILSETQARQVHRFLERIYGPNAWAKP